MLLVVGRSTFGCMPPKGRGRPSAKAKAAAKRLRVKNTRRSSRRLACQSLNDLARALHVADAKILDGKNPLAEDVEALVRILERRVHTPEQTATLRTATEKYLGNGGTFSVPLLDEEEVLPPAVPRHRLLQPKFELKSKAFMLTYHSSRFSLSTWAGFETFMKTLKKKLGARAWSACLELTLHATDNSSEKFHLHGYLLWNDGIGVHCQDLAVFIFDGVRPRIDVCISKAAAGSQHSAACHGLWYVWVMKAGTRRRATNYEPGIWYKPQATWLQSLYQDKKLSYTQYIEMSAQDFPIGHSSRKRDADEALRDLKRVAVEGLVAKELALLKTGRYVEPIFTAEENEFVQCFREDCWRRPILLFIGATNMGKSMRAGAMLLKVGEVLQLPEPSFIEVTVEGDAHLDLSELDVEKQSGVLLDGVSDTLLLKRNRETLQGRPKVLKGAKSATMMYSYPSR